MKRFLSLACTAALVMSFEPAMASPAPVGVPSVEPLVLVSSSGEPDATRSGHRRYQPHRHVGPDTGSDNGGYYVNRYGFGNYVGGPSGGFAGYPAGSAGAEIYRQKQEWKCQDVPEEC